MAVQSVRSELVVGTTTALKTGLTWTDDDGGGPQLSSAISVAAFDIAGDSLLAAGNPALIRQGPGPANNLKQVV